MFGRAWLTLGVSLTHRSEVVGVVGFPAVDCRQRLPHELAALFEVLLEAVVLGAEGASIRFEFFESIRHNVGGLA